MIIVQIWEGLGNQLFQYSFAKALQLRTGQKVFLDISEYSRDVPRMYGLGNFRISLPVTRIGCDLLDYADRHDLLKKIDTDSLRLGYGLPMKFGKESNVEFKPSILNPKGNWYLKGWFQNEKYFAGYREVIRKEIRPRAKIKVPPELKRIMEQNETVAVHFRRGDYQEGGNTLGMDYYRDALRMIESKVGTLYYLVFSDDLSWVRNHIDLGPRCYYVNEDRVLKDYEELMIMSRCSHNIIANSTFSWWGAWLNDHRGKIVIAPQIWFLRKRNFGRDIVPGEWIKL